MSRLGADIARLRNEKGMTQKQLGKMVGVSEGFIRDVESGRRVLNGDLATRISKILGRAEEIQEDYTNDSTVIHKTAGTNTVKAPPRPVQQIWNDALASVLKAVPVFGYPMDQEIGSRKLPIISNKVEGCPKDKVFYLKIEDEDMTGFRIFKGDLALACTMGEIDRDGLFFVEYNQKRAVRQIKRLSNEKLLLISNQNGISTETVEYKNLKVLARLIRLEITL